MSKILITGGTGLVGTNLTAHLAAHGYTLGHISRTKSSGAVPTFTWAELGNKKAMGEFLSPKAIVHLAGANVAEGRWTPARKKLIMDSRMQPTRQLFDYLSKLDQKPEIFVSASAIGIYGFDTGSQWVDEQSAQGNDFLAEVVKAWEQESRKIEELGIRLVTLRIGIVLAKEGGAFAKIVQPIRFGAGAPLGKGDQYMSWVHIDDLSRLITWAIANNSIKGTFNAISHQPVTNREFTTLAARALHKPLILPNVPSFAIKIIFGEMGNIVLGGNRVSNKKLLDQGFEFQYQSAEKAIENLLA